jgi:hypothetical protein
MDPDHKRGQMERTPEQAVLIIPPELRQRLGLLATVTEEEAKVNLGLRPYGHAMLLDAAGLVLYQDFPKSGLALAKNPNDISAMQMVQITEMGKRVMSYCQEQLPEGEAREKLETDLLNIDRDRMDVLINVLAPSANSA